MNRRLAAPVMSRTGSSQQLTSPFRRCDRFEIIEIGSNHGFGLGSVSALSESNSNSACAFPVISRREPPPVAFVIIADYLEAHDSSWPEAVSDFWAASYLLANEPTTPNELSYLDTELGAWRVAIGEADCGGCGGDGFSNKNRLPRVGWTTIGSAGTRYSTQTGPIGSGGVAVSEYTIDAGIDVSRDSVLAVDLTVDEGSLERVSVQVLVSADGVLYPSLCDTGGRNRSLGGGTRLLVPMENCGRDVTVLVNHNRPDELGESVSATITVELIDTVPGGDWITLGSVTDVDGGEVSTNGFRHTGWEYKAELTANAVGSLGGVVVGDFNTFDGLTLQRLRRITPTDRSEILLEFLAKPGALTDFRHPATLQFRSLAWVNNFDAKILGRPKVGNWHPHVGLNPDSAGFLPLGDAVDGVIYGTHWHKIDVAADQTLTFVATRSGGFNFEGAIWYGDGPEPISHRARVWRTRTGTINRTWTNTGPARTVYLRMSGFHGTFGPVIYNLTVT